MANKKITDLVEITSAANVDVLPIVDVSTDVTNKIKVENLPINTATQTALDAKQATLVSGTNIKTINSTTLLGSGDVAVQPTLVSGTNIKTINSTSLLGSGDIAIAANPAGTAGQIQFSDGSAFAADSNLFWDNTNKRLEVGYGNDGKMILTGGASFAQLLGGRQLRISSGGGNPIFIMPSGGSGVMINYLGANPSAQLQVRGSGSTSATTSLLVQNSSGTEMLKTGDSGITRISNGANGQYLEVNSANYLITNLYSQYHDSAGSVQFRNSAVTVLVGGSASESTAILNVQSTTRGFLPPRMTTTQKNAISTPAAGLMVYDTDTNKLCCYNGTTWNDLF